MDFGGTPTFVIVFRVVCHTRTVFENTEPVALDDRKVYEDILTVRTDDETEPLARIEPFHGSRDFAEGVG